MNTKKSVILSIQPEWCEKILNREKQYERCHDRPDIDVPFICYIYCTDGECLWKSGNRVFLDRIYNRLLDDIPNHLLNDKIVGEFVCNGISMVKGLYHWNISNLKAYDIPKHLSDFQIEDIPKPPHSWQYI